MNSFRFFDPYYHINNMDNKNNPLTFKIQTNNKLDKNMNKNKDLMMWLRIKSLKNN